MRLHICPMKKNDFALSIKFSRSLRSLYNVARLNPSVFAFVTYGLHYIGPTIDAATDPRVSVSVPVCVFQQKTERPRSTEEKTQKNVAYI